MSQTGTDYEFWELFDVCKHIVMNNVKKNLKIAIVQENPPIILHFSITEEGNPKDLHANL